MRILLIKPKHIGDTLILTPTITAIRQAHPEAEIWVIVRRGCEGILAGYPGIARILTLAGVEKSERGPGDFLRQVMMLLRLWSVSFDYVFELGDGHRARLMAMLARTKRRYSVKPASALKNFEQRRFTAISSFDAKALHRVEKDFYSVSEFLPLAEPIPPLSFEKSCTRPWAPAENLEKFAVMQIGKRQASSRWNREGWEEVARYLLERFGAVVVASGAGAEELADAMWLQDRLGPRVFCTLGRADWSQVAGLLYRAQIYVGLDTATMHLAAACGCPIVALFGPTIEEHWHPWRAKYRIVTSPGYVRVDDLKEREERIRKRRMDDIQPRDVVAAGEEILREKGQLQS
jgi:heptosyltransferase III